MKKIIYCLPSRRLFSLFALPPSAYFFYSDYSQAIPQKTYKGEYKLYSCMQEPPVLSGEAREGRV